MTDQRGSDKEAPSPPKRWWQWVLLYPTLGVAILSAVPLLTDKVLAFYHGTKTETYSGALKQRDMWAKNLECSASPFAWYNNPSNVKVDATMCPSGDLFVRAMTPDNQSFYHWVALDEVVKPVATTSGIIPAAKASVALNRAHPVRTKAKFPHLQLALQQAQVICQRQVDARIIIRRIATPQGCFDEFVDMFNGAVVGRRPAPCVPQC